MLIERNRNVPNSLKTIWSLGSMSSWQKSAQNQIFNLILVISSDKCYMGNQSCWAEDPILAPFRNKVLAIFLVSRLRYLSYSSTPLFNNELLCPSLCQELDRHKEDKGEKSLYLISGISCLVI